MSIFDGFEGYRDPSEAEVSTALESSFVVLDANVLLDLYSFDEPARNLALDVLEALGERVWVPHQVMLEFWRNRHSVLAQIEDSSPPFEATRNEMYALINRLRPDSQRTDAVDELKAQIAEKLLEVETALIAARGVPLDVNRLLVDTNSDPVIARLEMILRGRVGPGPDEQRLAELVDEGHLRFAAKTPPGFADYENKKDQPREAGTGDYIFWRQTLEFLASQAPGQPFVLVSNEKKVDWRTSVVTKQKTPLGVHPALVAEAEREVGGRVLLVAQRDFYRLRSSDDNRTESLIEASAKAAERDDEDDDATGWSEVLYAHLLAVLEKNGNDEQAAVIRFASANGGRIARAELYDLLGFAESRSLKRFALPALRAAENLVNFAGLSPDAEPPLVAIYKKPGRTWGYRVPDAFEVFATVGGVGDSHTWLDAAAEVAGAGVSGKWWTPGELVDQIVEDGLKDVSAAKTPIATLARDLRDRDHDRQFEADGEGRYRIRLSSE